jgi:hypothetical protein
VDELIKVEPWSVNESNPEQTNPNEEEFTQPEISQSHSNPQLENGSFIVYEKIGDFFDDDIRIMIEELHPWLKSQKDYKTSTVEACKYLYTKNPEFKKILESISGIRQLLIHTPSIQFEMPDATGGKNSLKLLHASQSVKYHLDRLGGRYGRGRIVSYYENEDVYDIQLWDRKAK